MLRSCILLPVLVLAPALALGADDHAPRPREAGVVRSGLLELRARLLTMVGHTNTASPFGSTADDGHSFVYLRVAT